MMNKTYILNGIEIVVNSISMGNDLCICIYGGNLPHLGAVALSIARPSLLDEKKISSSTSLITITGHKEDEIVMKVGKTIASSLNKNTVVCCGIHVDNIVKEDILNINSLIDTIISDLINHYL